MSSGDPSGESSFESERVAYAKRNSYHDEPASYFESDNSSTKIEVFSQGDSISSDGHSEVDVRPVAAVLMHFWRTMTLNIWLRSVMMIAGTLIAAKVGSMKFLHYLGCKLINLKSIMVIFFKECTICSDSDVHYIDESLQGLWDDHLK